VLVFGHDRGGLTGAISTTRLTKDWASWSAAISPATN